MPQLIERQPSPPLPVELFPADCVVCFAPIPVDAPMCRQCGAALYADPCDEGEAAPFGPDIGTVD